MKKYFLFLLAIMMVAMFSLSLTACSNGDENEGGGDNTSILGTWIGHNAVSGETLTLNLKSNGSGTWTTTKTSSSKIIGEGKLTYTVAENNTGTITIYGDFEDYEGKDMNAIIGNYKIEGNKLYFENKSLGYIVLTRDGEGSSVTPYPVRS